MSKMLYLRKNLPFDLYEINLLKADEKQLLQISEELGLALNIAEMKAIKRYFEEKGRNPMDIELQTLGQTWSEHCYHKTFKGTVITPDGKEIKSLFRTYIAKVTSELNMPWCISVFEDNAGIIQFESEYA
ncbi:MAG: phosphoribosylformylglycinamidine synthase, partial [Candidatus Bathyarchaeia archaeon]